MNAAQDRAARRRFRLALCGFAAALILVPFSYKVERRLETAVHIRGGEAERVDRELAEQFGSPYVHRLVLVATGLPDAESSEGRQAVAKLAASMRAEPGVSGVLTHAEWPDDLFIGKDGGGALLIVGMQPADGDIEAMIPRLRLRADDLQQQLRAHYPSTQLQLTGETALNVDLRKVSAEDVNHAEARVLPVTLILLLLAFGSLLAALLPLGVGMLAISMTMGAAALLANRLHLSILVQNLATMLGLGLGIDYALLMVSRFREGLAQDLDVGDAADIAAHQAGKTLVISAATVAIGFAALMTVPISELSSIGVAGLLVAAMSVLLATTILPWLLAKLGARVNAWRLRLPSGWIGSDGENPAAIGRRWRAWGMIVTGRPWTALLVAGVPLLLLSAQALKIAPGFPPGDWLPKSAESVQALYRLEGMGRAGIVQSMRIVLEFPASSGTTTSPTISQTGWLGIQRLVRALAADPRAEEVISLPGLLGSSAKAENLPLVPEATRKSFLRKDGRATLLEVLPAAGVSAADQMSWVRQLRCSDAATLTGVRGATLRIGGIPALNADYDQVVKERLPRVMAMVIGGSFLALLLGLRSIFAAVKAIALNLLSVGSAFGALVLVFQQGHGSRWFGVTLGTGYVFPIVPILSFAIVFGLSMDYEVFLVARVLEERRRGMSERAAVVEAMASTARLITSAAAIMIAVFAAFTLGSFLVVKMLGFTLAVAVFIDATVVRMVIGPALLYLAGDWNWWPYGLAGSDAQTNAEGGL